MPTLSLKNKVFVFFISLIILVIFYFLFSFKLLDVPPGINSDEASSGFNGVLLSKNLRDENNRFLPFFVLTLDGKDWRNPVYQYTMVLIFKVLGASYYNLRLVSVIFALLSIVLIFFLLYKFEGWKLAVLGVTLLATTPILMIQAHLAHENIAPVPFIIIFLLGILLYQRKGKWRYLTLSALSLGISFYSYKALRLFVPVWAVLTYLYIVYLNSKFDFSKQTIIKSFKAILVFSIALLPFFAIIPILELKYAGAIAGGSNPSIDSYQNFFYYYLSNFDPAFLYVSGDATPYHSTGKHGALLLTSLPLFLIGAYQAIRKNSFVVFCLACFLFAPLFFGLVGSFHRANRLLAMLPPYIVVASYGGYRLWELRNRARSLWKKKALSASFLTGAILLTLNYVDFLGFYYFKYPVEVRAHFSNNSHDSYFMLSKEAKKNKLEPFIESDIYRSDGYAAKFFESSYFDRKILKWTPGTKVPATSILLTNSEILEGMKKIDLKIPVYSLQIPK
ncbi:glycosyltransferase family 39 protein [Candidatus Daviesbacteria bacterium]|nr:glycosyltransferase family 39 protein [Candidatus Daviesbacteria bacterium]